MDYHENGINFNKSQFYYLYKEIQNEIKDKVISKLLLKVQNMYNELTILKSENISLKKHLSYILKRIILHKNEYNNNNKNKIYNSSINIKKPFLNGSSLIKDSFLKGSQNSFKPLRIVENYRCITEEDFYIFLNKNKKKKNNIGKINNDVKYIYDQHNSSAIDNKINGYLNSIYRNNFVKGNSGVSDKFNLNKNKTIYEELFLHNNNKHYKTISQEESYVGKKIRSKNLSTKGSSLIKKNGNKKNVKVIKPVKNNNNNKKHPIRVKNYREEQIKGGYFDTSKLFDENDFKYEFEDYFTSRNNENKIKKKNNKYNYKNPKNNYGVKIKTKKDLFYDKRSPFLINKY